MQTAIPCVVMRGGTSRGLYFLRAHLPADDELRNRVLLTAMGSPDRRQIDGMGGGHPLTSKVAVIGPPSRPDVDVDYLFLQVMVDRAEVSDGQNCGNILAGVGPFALERGLVRPGSPYSDVRIHMVNTGGVAVARVLSPGGSVRYGGDARIDGVPGTAAPIALDFRDVAGSSCGALLPTGSVMDMVRGVEVTCIDNGMPVVVIRAADVGKTGYETPEELEADETLRRRIEAIRLELGPRMKLDDVSGKTVPKMCLVAPPRAGGQICTRTFIPHRVHEAIGVLGAVSVASACALPGSVAFDMAGVNPGYGTICINVEHPTGVFATELELAKDKRGVRFCRSALVRTARKLMEGSVFIPSRIWGGP